MNKLLSALLALSLLSACNMQPSPGYRAADNLVVCGAKSGDAYFVRPGSGDNSYVQRMPSIDQLCVKYAPTPLPVLPLTPQPAASAASA